MRKQFLFILFVAVLCLFVSCATEKGVLSENAGKPVAALFAKEDAQSYTERDGDRENLDTLWVYYTDGTFDQYAEEDDKLVLFSTGTYSLSEGDFVYGNDEEDYGDITIVREMKYRDGKLSAYSSVHTYDLGSLGYVQLYALCDETKTVEAMYYGIEKQLFVERDGDREYLDTIWIYYSDMTFEQYAAVDDEMILFSLGTYSFVENDGSFCGPEDNIQLNRTMKYSAENGLAEYFSSHVYDINSLGFVQITCHKD